MCHIRRVYYYYPRCDHEIQLEDTPVSCGSRWCRISELHPADCRPPSCTRTCFQVRTQPQDYSAYVCSSPKGLPNWSDRASV
ncbi:hypothetical protein FA95DRAFT_28265 [Auriscalpium vulgare]|uniref:Uncharacterized protein n=1 Tax=Auriscalpium vulgare TaxID=40419 RepID=A0ACB8SDP9_9AGAM|nr:hypothetical protein FA95DRAFT_28265 [Auriscalpium vulgare]